MINVTKKDGELEPFKTGKIEKTIRKAGASAAIAKKIATSIQKVAYDGITTDEIRRIILEQLKRLDKNAAEAYSAYQKTED